jgi:hypothetical protein
MQQAFRKFSRDRCAQSIYLKSIPSPSFFTSPKTACGCSGLSISYPSEAHVVRFCFRTSSKLDLIGYIWSFNMTHSDTDIIEQ